MALLYIRRARHKDYMLYSGILVTLASQLVVSIANYSFSPYEVGIAPNVLVAVLGLGLGTLPHPLVRKFRRQDAVGASRTQNHLK